MLIGIGIIGMLTGSLTTYFVKEKNAENPTVAFIQSELDRYGELTLGKKAAGDATARIKTLNLYDTYY